MTRVYYREAVGALMVFDVTRASTFDAVLKWKDDLDSKVRRPNAKTEVFLSFLSFCPFRRCRNQVCVIPAQPQPHPEGVRSKVEVS